MTSYSTICPNCGANNSGDDLFCKDCGASLATSQQTAVFTPVDAASYTQTTTIAPAAPPRSLPPSPMPVQVPPAHIPPIAPESSVRGAMLGWIAVLLMVLVIGAFVWINILSDIVRERVLGIF